MNDNDIKTNWSDEQIIALAESIEHWYENWLNPETANPFGAGCPCCKRYAQELGCSDCPIATTTGKDECENTPWRTAMLAVCAVQDAAIVESPLTPYKVIRAKQEIEVEYRFLIDVLVNPESITPFEED